MADQKLSQLTELTTFPESADEFYVRDESEAASAESKRITAATLFPSIGSVNQATGPTLDIPTSTATGATNTYYATQVRISHRVGINGILYRVGATANGNARSALYDSGGNVVASRTTNAAQSTPGANGIHTVTFDSQYAAVPGLYYMLIWLSSATGTTVANVFGAASATGTNVGGVPSSITPATAAAFRTIMATF